MKDLRPIVVGAAGLAAILALGAAQRPTALTPTSPGLWEISGAPGAKGPAQICLANTATLAQFEHRGQQCTRLVISDTPPTTLIHYTCPRGGFGQSKLTVITPRSIRIETQGISDNLPFNYVIQARRVGECSPRSFAAAH